MPEKLENTKEITGTGDDATGGKLSREAASDGKRSYLESLVHATAGRLWDSEEVDRRVADGLKTAGLFLRGRVGLAGTVVLYAADQASPADNFSSQLADAGLGAVKGGLLKGTFDVLGKKDVSVAARGVGLGVSSRVLEIGLSRQTYADPRTGKLDLEAGLKNAAVGSLNRQALVADVVVFTAAHGMMAGLNRATIGGLKSSPFWSTALTGTTFGVASGATGELMRQQSAGEPLNVSRAVGKGLTQGAIDTLAAMPGGVQAQAGLHRRFKDSFGVLIRGEKGSYRLMLGAGGENRALFVSEASVAGLKQAEQHLVLLSRKMQNDLTDRFKVEFSKPGETIELPWLKADGPGKGSGDVKARAPRLDELVGIAAALEHSVPSNLSADGKQGVKFYFYPDRHLNIGALAHFELGKRGRPEVYMKTEAWENKPATERDRDVDAVYYEHKRDSIEALVAHELGHNGQLKMGWGQPGKEESVAQALGWVSLTDAAGKTRYALRAKNGEQYQYFAAARGWMRVNDKGEPLDWSGRPAPVSEGTGLPDTHMRSLALVTPVSRYFPNPAEMLVEGLMFLRLNAQRRATLLKESPVLYDLVKNWDQSEINHHHGLGADGQPKMVRLPDGTLASRDARAMSIIAEFERARSSRL
jgi:hypothetical protein